MDLKLFNKCKCKGFYKKIRDGIWIELNEDDLMAVLKNSNAWSESNDNCIVEENIDCAEKRYYEHVDSNFSGIIVGFKDITVVGYLDVNYEDAVDVGIGIIPEKYYVSKRPKEIVKCAIVYYANNMKHYTPLDDIVEIVGNED